MLSFKWQTLLDTSLIVLSSLVIASHMIVLCVFCKQSLVQWDSLKLGILGTLIWKDF